MAAPAGTAPASSALAGIVIGLVGLVHVDGILCTTPAVHRVGDCRVHNGAVFCVPQL
jgi:hypothetical protein